MRLLPTLGACALVLLVFGCGHSTGHDHDGDSSEPTTSQPSDHETPTETHPGSDHSPSGNSDHGHGHHPAAGEPATPPDLALQDIADHGLQTQDGEKWPMDDHTRAMFAAMAGRLEGFEGDLPALGATLQDDLRELIAGCTMTGAAHDELHKFLGLYMPAVSRLAEAGQADDLEQIRQLLALYPSYFE